MGNVGEGLPLRPLLRISLAAEVEWGNYEKIVDDFEKLIQSNADVKLMIYNACAQNRDSIPYAEELANLLLQYKGYQQTHTNYLFAELEWADKDNYEWQFS